MCMVVAVLLTFDVMNHLFIVGPLFFFLSILISVNSDIYDEGKFFDPQNFTDADCIVGNDYIYLGIKSTEKNGASCEIWENVRLFHLELFKGYNQFFFADEYLNHNFCRNIPLDAYQHDSRFNNATAHHYAQVDGWMEGPWCYVKLPEGSEINLWGTFKTKYIPMPCFEQCYGEPQNVAVSTPLPKTENATTKFNSKLIEHLAQNLFYEFDHGNKTYYESKPSDKNVSIEFQSNAKIIFYVGMSFLILSVTVIFAKHYYGKWKKRPKNEKKEVKEGDQEEENVEKKDQNENPNEQPEIKVEEMPKITTISEEKLAPLRKR